ncbi:MAG: helix-hairpin-helix domain-containing protein [Candidatus Promineifilaceae bacterium]|jgi:predicted flap endonuclease-1-like 5' DNA nuclease
MKNDSIRYYWLGFIAALVGVGWLIWLYRKQREVTPTPLYITGRTAAYPMSDEKPEVPLRQDDLTQIQGIGPSYASRLNEAGIGTYSQLAEANPDDLRQITGVTRWDPTEWIEQARSLAS